MEFTPSDVVFGWHTVEPQPTGPCSLSPEPFVGVAIPVSSVIKTIIATTIMLYFISKVH